jgi:hypothetical protein
MRSALNQKRHDQPFVDWTSLPLGEKKRQFQELVRSPYWHFLPEEIKDHLHDLVSYREEH